MSKKFVVILLNFIVMLVVAFVLIMQINKAKGLTDVYVAKVPINKGTKITSDMIVKTSVAVNKAKPNSRDVVSYYGGVIINDKDVLGQYAKYDLVKGEIIVKEKLAGTQSRAEESLNNIPEGYYAYVLPITDEGKSGIIKVDDYIDLYVKTKDQDVIADDALRGLKVYDLRADDTTSVASQQAKASSDQEQAKVAKYVVLALNDYQLRKLITYQTMDQTVMKIGIRKRVPESEALVSPIADYPNRSTAPNQSIDKNAEKALREGNYYESGSTVTQPAAGAPVQQ